MRTQAAHQAGCSTNAAEFFILRAHHMFRSDSGRSASGHELRPRPVQERNNMTAGNALVGQSGGPTSVINASLAGVVDTALRSKQIGSVYGMRFGIEGVLENRLLDFSTLDAETLKGLRKTPSSALGSSRLKLQQEHFEPILKLLRKRDIRYFFMVGGNDTMDTIHRVVEYARENGWEMTGVGVPKTVDNDLFGTDHTPGYPSAARFVALSVLQGGILARDMQRVDQFTIFQTVGRSAGWLPAAAAAARRKAGDPPHVILLPERPFHRGEFLDAVQNAHAKWGYVSIVCGEGITNPDGTPVSASETRDKFDNVEFGAMGGTSAAMILHRIIADEFGWRGEFQVCESLQMCAADRVVDLDVKEAYGCGKQAVSLALKNEGGVMVTIERTSKRGEPYAIEFGTAPLSEVANHERPMPDKYIARSGMDVTKAFLDYLSPLIGELPEYVTLPKK
jgi:ATP-dependent phosphofructokinase / diphosphate-dependent phosphofructokinase